MNFLTIHTFWYDIVSIPLNTSGLNQPSWQDALAICDEVNVSIPLNTSGLNQQGHQHFDQIVAAYKFQSLLIRQVLINEARN